jgi:hypothetical protein
MAKEAVDYTIKPEATASTINTEDWPLLLKNYDKRTFVLLCCPVHVSLRDSTRIQNHFL